MPSRQATGRKASSGVSGLSRNTRPTMRNPICTCRAAVSPAARMMLASQVTMVMVARVITEVPFRIIGSCTSNNTGAAITRKMPIR